MKITELDKIANSEFLWTQYVYLRVKYTVHTHIKNIEINTGLPQNLQQYSKRKYIAMLIKSTGKIYYACIQNMNLCIQYPVAVKRIDSNISHFLPIVRHRRHRCSLI